MKKNYLLAFVCCIIILTCAFNTDKISNKMVEILDNNPRVVILPGNEYTKKASYGFVKISKDFIPYSYNDLLDILYSAINNGWEQFTFYCPNEYIECLKDIEKISNDSLLLTHLNNFVHPFNSFTNLKTSISESGEINLTISYLYSKEEEKYIIEEVKKIINENITDDLSDYDKIKVLHDYIINNTKYDVTRNETGTSDYESYKASSLLKNHIATCNGYSDTFAIILSELGFDNYKIATTPEEISYESTGHVWNAVYLNNQWLHLDLTWDDPVSSDGIDYLYHKYFLVNNAELAEADKGDVKIEEHNFNRSIYTEFLD